MPFADEFNAMKLRLASPEVILNWSRGEVVKPETINYRTQRPEKDGLFSEVIFGPEKDFQCYCGKYKKARYKGITCDKCGVEVTRAIVRRERMGHITLAAPVAHIWFLRKLPSKIALFFDIPIQQLEKVIYFASYIVTSVNEGERQRAIKMIDEDFNDALKKQGLGGKKRESLKEDELKAFRHLEEERKSVVDDLTKLRLYQVLPETDYQQLARRFPGVFEAGIGAEALRQLCEAADLKGIQRELEALREKTTTATTRKKIMTRLKLVNGFLQAGVRPEWMFITVLPIIPPDLRPMVQLDGGRFASSDVNDLYRRVINRNNRLKKLKELNAPEVIMRNEKRMLQEAVDALIDNAARRGRAVMASTGQRRPLKSLADMLKGKQGRFRRNLLGKRVDYSGRSVIVAGATLKLHECGLPKKMALEIFKPFVIAKLLKRGLAHNVRGAGHLIEDGIPEVWDILDEVTSTHYVLLNRAPTLHRLGIQAFQPVLVEGSAIQLHPLVCSAYNADFDGDQMAVHLPLSDEAQYEAETLMLASRNLLKPATGRPIVSPTKDMVLGIYWLTQIKAGELGEGTYFGDPDEAVLAAQSGKASLRAQVLVRLNPAAATKEQFTETSIGRILFNRVLPQEITGFVNKHLNAGGLKDLLQPIMVQMEPELVSEILDQIKEIGFYYSTISGITWSMSDLTTPVEKPGIIKKAEDEVAKVHANYENVLLLDSERYDRVVEIWERARGELAAVVKPAIQKSDAVFSIIDSGARGSWGQVGQMVGMKGLVINPANEIIELPIKSSFKEGFNVLEYFNSTHGARKGTTDTALRTAAAGYLTRRLIDVAHDVIVRAEDCGSHDGLDFSPEGAQNVGVKWTDQLYGRVPALTVKDPKTGQVIIKAGEIITAEFAEKIAAAKELKSIKLRSPITCKITDGICQKCYGMDLGRSAPVALGEAVGIVAAQSIGEPGTQLTMRTFHMGGVTGSADITQGLPRVEEIFEARSPKSKALISEVTGKVKSITDDGDRRTIKIKPADDDQELSYTVPLDFTIWFKEGDLINKGDQLTDGHVDLQELYEVMGHEAVYQYIMSEVQKIYASKGADINDKHIEIIIRKMFSRIRVTSPGETELLPGKVVEENIFETENNRAKAAGLTIGKGKVLLLGITKVALSTDSFLSAASFQETAQALIDAAVEGKVDRLRGLKENVIIGHLVPAGTGFPGSTFKQTVAEVLAARRAEMIEEVEPTPVGSDLAGSEVVSV